MGEVQEHHDQLPPDGTVVGAQQGARKQRAADQRSNLYGRADDQRQAENERDNSWQFNREPVGRNPSEVKRLRPEEDLQQESDDGQRRGHDERPHDDFGSERQSPQRRAEA
jgi:hypothetical protein